MQGFALRCVATGSAYKMIWTATQHRNRKKFLSLRCFAIQIILYALPVATQCSATLASYYKPAFRHEVKYTSKTLQAPQISN